jgi:hypothetical protein
MSLLKRLSFAMAGICLASAGAMAASIDWTVNGTFIDAANPTDIITLTGQVYYNPDTNTYGSYSFTTTETGTYVGTPVVDITSAWQIDTACCYPANGEFILVDGPAAGPLNGIDGITIVADDSLTDSGGTIPFDNNNGFAESAICSEPDCSLYQGVDTPSGYLADGSGTFFASVPASNPSNPNPSNPNPSNPATTPEPATLFLGGTALLAVGLGRKKFFVR